jgi:DNA polymerase theta
LDSVQSSFRPIPLKEYFKIGNVIYNKDGSISRQLKPSSDEQDRDHLIPLCEEILPEHSLLIFCPTKRGSQETALLLARRLSPSLREHKKQEKLLFLQQLRAINVNGNVDENLQETVPLGVAFHHSGLTVEERELIEQAFRDKVINIICCTSTLAAGVNLPARRVILRSPMMGGRYLTTRDYKQMSGRAGRAGIDTFGESVLILRPNQRELGMQLLNSPLQHISSCLHKCGKGFNRLVLEAIGGKYAVTSADVKSFLNCTFLAKSQPQDIEQEVESALSYLLQNGFIVCKSNSEHKNTTEAVDTENDKLQNANERHKVTTYFEVTSLGAATYRSSFSPEEAVIVREELTRARQCLILADDLHLCYLVTPIFGIPLPPDWAYYSDLFAALPEIKKNIGHAVGVTEKYLLDRSFGHQPNTPHKARYERIAKRFYCALILCELIHEAKVWDVSKKYRTLQSAVVGACVRWYLIL